MTDPVTGPAAATWQKNFLQRFHTCKASLRALQMEKERLCDKRNKATIKKLRVYFDAVDEAWNAMNAIPPESENKGMTADDRAIEKGLVDVSTLTAEDLAEYGHK